MLNNLSTFKNLTDEALIRLVQDRNEAAFTELIFRYTPRIWTLIVRNSRQRQDAEEIRNDVWMAVWQNIKGLQKVESFGEWLQRIAYNACKRYYASGKRSRHEIPHTYAVLVEHIDRNATARYRETQLIAEVKEAVHHLPPKVRSVAELYYLESWNIKEIAEALDLPIGTVKTKLREIRARLREEFDVEPTGSVNTMQNRSPAQFNAVSNDLLPSGSAQDYTRWGLPEGAIARFGKGTLTDCVYLPDGNRLAVLSSIGTWIYDVRTGEALDIITEPLTEDMRLSPDGKSLAAASDGSVYLWDLDAKKLRNVLVGDTNRIHSLAFSPTGETLAGATWNNAIQLWDVYTGKLLKTFIGHTDLSTRSMSIHSIAHSKDQKLLASVSWEDRTIRIWDVETGQLLQTIDERAKRIYSVEYSPDSRTLASAEEDSKIRIWDVDTGALLKTLTGHTSAVNTMTYSPDGKTLVSGSWDKTIRFWNASTGKLLKTLTGHTEVVDTVIYAPDGKTVTSMSSYDGTIRFWDAETTKLLKTITGHTGSFGRAVAFSPDGQMLAHSGTGDSTIPIRDGQSGQLLRTLTGHTDTVLSIAYSPDGRNLVSGNWDGHIRMWDIDTGALLKTLTGHEKGVPSLVYSPDGATLISGSWDNTIRIWDVDTGQPLQTIIGNTTELEPSQGVRVISLSPDGQTVASATDEKVIRLWDVHTGKLTGSLVGHTNEVAAVAFSPRGTVLASGGDDATLRLWDVEAGKLLNTFKEPTKSSVLSVAFSPDGRILASGCYAMVRLRDTFTERSTVTLTGHTTWVRALAFSPDGRILASIDEDGVVILWDMNQVKWQ